MAVLSGFPAFLLFLFPVSFSLSTHTHTFISPNCNSSFDPAAESLHDYVFLILYWVYTYHRITLTTIFALNHTNTPMQSHAGTDTQTHTHTHTHTHKYTHWPRGTFTSSPLSGVNAAFPHMNYVLVKTRIVALNGSACLDLQSSRTCQDCLNCTRAKMEPLCFLSRCPQADCLLWPDSYGACDWLSTVSLFPPPG